MARVTGVQTTDLRKIEVTPVTTGSTQLEQISGTIAIQSNGSYDFELSVGIYDFSLYDSKNEKRSYRRGVNILPTDTTITLEGLLERL